MELPFSFLGGGLGPCSLWDLSSLTRDRIHASCSGSTGSQPLSCRQVPCFFLVFFAGVWNSQSCGHEQSLVPLHISVHLPKVYRCSCLHTWISFNGADNIATYAHSHRSVLTCVLMCVDLCIRTLGNTGPPVLPCFTDNA